MTWHQRFGHPCGFQARLGQAQGAPACLGLGVGTHRSRHAGQDGRKTECQYHEGDEDFEQRKAPFAATSLGDHEGSCR
jgi:hypothetical protein